MNTIPFKHHIGIDGLNPKTVLGFTDLPQLLTVLVSALSTAGWCLRVIRIVARHLLLEASLLSRPEASWWLLNALPASATFLCSCCLSQCRDKGGSGAADESVSTYLGLPAQQRSSPSPVYTTVLHVWKRRWHISFCTNTSQELGGRAIIGSWRG